jgi:hypothetical protein
MHARTTSGPRTTQRRTVATGAAAALALAGVALAAGAAVAGAIGVGTATTAAPPSAAAPAGAMAALWAQTDPGARATVCTAFQLDPAGTWQTLAPVLVEAGASRAEAMAVLGEQCSPERSVEDLRG